MANDFFARTEELAEMVGDGDLIGHFRVEREYAAVQHEQGWRNFMGRYGAKEIKVYHRGGGPKFVEGPLKENYPEFYQDLADAVLEGRLIQAMITNMEEMDAELRVRAPVEDGDLRRAGSIAVTDDGDLVFYKAPEVPYSDEGR